MLSLSFTYHLVDSLALARLFFLVPAERGSEDLVFLIHQASDADRLKEVLVHCRSVNYDPLDHLHSVAIRVNRFRLDRKSGEANTGLVGEGIMRRSASSPSQTSR